MAMFAENIRFLRSQQNLSQTSLAELFGLTRGQLASYEDARAEPNQETLVKYSTHFKLPIDALIKFDLTKAADGNFMNLFDNKILFPVQVNADNEDLIELVPVKASAGYLAGHADPGYISRLPQLKLPFIPTGKHRAFPIMGDSMEPGVHDGAFVVAKYLEDKRSIINGQTYIVVTHFDGLSYKRVFLDKIKDGILILKSDNNYYQPFEVHLNEVVELWEYTCKIDLQAYKPEDLNLESIVRMMREFQIELAQIKKGLIVGEA
jgi:transcriptional regulator with XRE-family HTH domain